MTRRFGLFGLVLVAAGYSQQAVHADNAAVAASSCDTIQTDLRIGDLDGDGTTDLVTGGIKSTGTNVHIIVPGQGTVQLAAGLSLDVNGNLVKQVGRQDPPVTSALCEALA